MDGRLMKLLKYGDSPCAYHLERINGKSMRKKYDSYNSFLADARKDEQIQKSVIDDVFAQRSLLDDRVFIMVFAHEE